MSAVDLLRGKLVLLVEDESLVSMLAEDHLSDAGCEVLLAMRLNEALQLAKEAQFDFAILDVNLGGEDTSYPIAEVLAHREIPFVFVTGHDASALDHQFSDRPWVQKPYTRESLTKMASAVLTERP